MESRNYSVIKLSQELLIGEAVTEELIAKTVEQVGIKFFPGRFDQEVCVTELKRRNNVQ